MKRMILAVCAAALSAAPVRAAEPQEATRAIKGIVDAVRSGDDEVIIQEKLPGDEWSAPKRVSRDVVLSALYLNLAGLEYAHAVETGLAVDQKPEVEAALSRVQKNSKAPTQDVQAVTMDPEALKNAGGCSGSSYCCGGYNYLGFCNRWCRTCVSAVRGGRKADARLDKKLSALDRSLEEASREAGGPSAESQAEVHLERARIYEKMAKTTAAAALPAAGKAGARPSDDGPRNDMIQDVGTRQITPDSVP